MYTSDSLHIPAAPLMRRTKNLGSQIGAFSLLGIVNTLLDFVVLNVGTFYLNYPLLLVNLVSTSLALTFSYYFSKSWVFSGSETGKKSILLFIVITLAGLYGLQSLIIYVFTNHILFPAEFASAILNSLNFTRFSNEFIVGNTAKLVATIASAVWNFTLYKKVVFKV